MCDNVYFVLAQPIVIIIIQVDKVGAYNLVSMSYASDYSLTFVTLVSII